MRLVIRENKDSVLTKQIKDGIKDNDGYCPCRLTKTPDTKCMCKEFREQDHPGWCHCGLYEKVETSDEERMIESHEEVKVKKKWDWK